MGPLRPLSGRGRLFLQDGGASAHTGEVSISSSRRATAGVRLSIDRELGPLFEHNAVLGFQARGGPVQGAPRQPAEGPRHRRSASWCGVGYRADKTRASQAGPGRWRVGWRRERVEVDGQGVERRGLWFGRGHVPGRPTRIRRRPICTAVPTLPRPAPAMGRHSAAATSGAPRALPVG